MISCLACIRLLPVFCKQGKGLIASSMAKITCRGGSATQNLVQSKIFVDFYYLIMIGHLFGIKSVNVKVINDELGKVWTEMVVVLSCCGRQGSGIGI